VSDRRVVITGIGIINPAGLGLSRFWQNVTAGRLSIRRIGRFDPGQFPAQVAGELVDFRPADYISRRWVVKTDTFIHYSLAASKLALEDAGIDPAKQDPFRIGVFFGNNSGGWDISERGWYEFHQQGPRETNPWQATAWFPAGAQGFVTILFGLKGYSKSFVCDRASGAYGLYFGARSIQLGHNDVVLAGGTEAPISRLGLTCYIGTGDLALAREPEGAYRPFDAHRAGLVLGEGSTVLVLEELAHAQARGARIYGEYLGGATTSDPAPQSHAGLVRAMRKALSASSVAPSEVDLVLPEGCGSPLGDQVEARALEEVLGARVAKVPITVPKATYGHLYGAATATELVCGLMAIREGIIPPTLSFAEADPDCRLRIVARPERRAVSKIVANARSREGVNVSLVVGAL
jgi:3-oxoacyl-[acyl-carrier-protein] synthase II